jgi:hypothetical protein
VSLFLFSLRHACHARRWLHRQVSLVDSKCMTVVTPSSVPCGHHMQNGGYTVKCPLWTLALTSALVVVRLACFACYDGLSVMNPMWTYVKTFALVAVIAACMSCFDGLSVACPMWTLAWYQSLVVVIQPYLAAHSIHWIAAVSATICKEASAWWRSQGSSMIFSPVLIPSPVERILFVVWQLC